MLADVSWDIGSTRLSVHPYGGTKMLQERKEFLIQTTVYLTEAHRAVILEVGEDSLSAGVRALCEWYAKAKAAHEASEKES